MDDTIGRKRLMVLIIGIVSIFAIWLPQEATLQEDPAYLQVHFLDVGQGDAIFIETPLGVQVLIDGGPDSRVLQELSKKMSFTDRTIDMIVGTHPDTDHIGGLIDVLAHYEVGTILTTENKGESSTALQYETVKSAEKAAIVYARRGQEIALDASTTIKVLFPDSNPATMESNTSSIVLQLVYGDTTFLFTGDSPKSIEEYLVLVEGEYLQSDVLKVGHHGSRTSTSLLFLDEVQPTIGVISAGKDNSYGHPHTEVTDALFNAGTSILQTTEGTVTLLSDGKTVWKQ